MKNLTQIVQELGARLLAQQQVLVTAESCTGGGVAQAITAIAGSSTWFERGFITYSDQAKQEMLAVKTTTLVEHGAVSAQTAKEMAQGALAHSHADVSLAVTGIAGPEGGSVDKPVGTVFFAWAGKPFTIEMQRQQFDGDRSGVRQQAVEFSLRKLLYLLDPPF